MDREYIISGIQYFTATVYRMKSTLHYTSTIIIPCAIYRQRYHIESLFTNSDSDALDLVKKLLVFNPERRLTSEEALRHPYVRRFHNPADEVVAGHDVVPPVSDNEQLTIGEYRDRLYEVSFHNFFNVLFYSRYPSLLQRSSVEPFQFAIFPFYMEFYSRGLSHLVLFIKESSGLFIFDVLPP